MEQALWVPEPLREETRAALRNRLELPSSGPRAWAVGVGARAVSRGMHGSDSSLGPDLLSGLRCSRRQLRAGGGRQVAGPLTSNDSLRNHCIKRRTRGLLPARGLLPHLNLRTWRSLYLFLVGTAMSARDTAVPRHSACLELQLYSQPALLPTPTPSGPLPSLPGCLAGFSQHLPRTLSSHTSHVL